MYMNPHHSRQEAPCHAYHQMYGGLYRQQQIVNTFEYIHFQALPIALQSGIQHNMVNLTQILRINIILYSLNSKYEVST